MIRTSPVKKVLILDYRDNRRRQLADMAMRFGDLSVVPKSAITRQQFITGGFDIAVVHYGNDDGPAIEDGWEAPKTKVILFSGNFRQNIAETEDSIYVSARYLQDEECFKALLQKVFAG